LKAYIQTKTHIIMFTEASFTIDKRWDKKANKCPSSDELVR
jgi:hypothetical protein